jgi:hypothetical protein
MKKSQLKQLIEECINEIQNDIAKLSDVYDGTIPDDESALREYVKPNEWDMYYPLKVLSVNDLKNLRAYYSQENILKDFNGRKTKNSIDKVNKLRRLLKSNQDLGLVVVSRNLIIDGHHRVIAAIMENKPLTVIDIESNVK